MNPPVDTTGFQLGGVPDAEEDALLLERQQEALTYVGQFPWAKPVTETLLAFGVSRIISLFLLRFDEPISWDNEVDRELWVVVGDLPPAYFATDDSPNATEALETYCVFMEDWADRVLNGEDLRGAYPVSAAPTEEHGAMLKSRVEFIREEIIPLVSATRTAPEA